MPFKLFSARNLPTKEGLPYRYDNVPQALRVQAWYILEKAFGKHYVEPYEWADASQSYYLWTSLRDILKVERGVFYLSSEPLTSPKRDCFQFFINETDASGALDFIDLGFRIVDKGLRAVEPYRLQEAGVEIAPNEAISETKCTARSTPLGLPVYWR